MCFQLDIILTRFHAQSQKQMSHYPLWKSKKSLTLSPWPSVGLTWVQLFSFSLLRCHNGSEPDTDGGERGVIKSNLKRAYVTPMQCQVTATLQENVCFGLVFLLTNKGMLLMRQHDATSRTLTAEHPRTAAIRTANQVWSCRKGICVSARGAAVAAFGGWKAKKIMLVFFFFFLINS